MRSHENLRLSFVFITQAQETPEVITTTTEAEKVVEGTTTDVPSDKEHGDRQVC